MGAGTDHRGAWSICYGRQEGPGRNTGRHRNPGQMKLRMPRICRSVGPSDPVSERRRNRAGVSGGRGRTHPEPSDYLPRHPARAIPRHMAACASAARAPPPRRRISALPSSSPARFPPPNQRHCSCTAGGQHVDSAAARAWAAAFHAALERYIRAKGIAGKAHADLLLMARGARYRHRSLKGMGERVGGHCAETIRGKFCSEGGKGDA